MLIKRDIYALGLPHRAVAVYMYLCDRADDAGACFPSHRTI
ncbi:helix-turn-helix domain-containing protein, partial [Oscillospiraceae bacterium OttesenSCG-928-G22]|nr:helix-turn-helix domain-containing protein [Oscillospiraceae bacterium OttesenSCG-928-G22]